jgi:hypothetical protein
VAKHRQFGEAFLITAEPRNHSGPMMFFTRKKFSNHGTPARFRSLHAAQQVARWLVGHFDVLRTYRVRVTGLDPLSRPVGVWQMNPLGAFALLSHAAAGKNIHEAVRKNPHLRPSRLSQAGKLLKDFSGHAPTEILRVPVKNIKRGLVIGTLDAVPYTTIRDGRTERYIHRFKADARPLLVASSDGRRLGIVGGRFQFTEAGIVDD